jgi:hypothetical protein
LQGGAGVLVNRTFHRFRRERRAHAQSTILRINKEGRVAGTWGQCQPLQDGWGYTRGGPYVRPGRTALGALVFAVTAAAGALATARGEQLGQSLAQASPREESGNPKDSLPKESLPKDSVPNDGAPKPAEEAQKSRLVSILGREVTNREGDGGRVIDVLVDLDGRSGAVVVEFGGFMGIGSRKVAVDWGALRFVREANRSLLTIDISREQIRNAPEYKPNEQPAVLGTK